MTCDKCLTEDVGYEKYAYLELDGDGLVAIKNVSLCLRCNNIFKMNLLPDFMREDFGCFPINKGDRSIIEARKKRALGLSPWNKLNGDNKGQDENRNENDA